MLTSLSAIAERTSLARAWRWSASGRQEKKATVSSSSTMVGSRCAAVVIATSISLLTIRRSKYSDMWMAAGESQLAARPRGLRPSSRVSP